MGLPCLCFSFHCRPSIIPGPAPDEIVVPATESVGVKLLLKMGWSRSRSIKDSHSDALYDARRQARRAFLAFSSDDPAVKITESELIKGDSENFPEQLVDDDQFSKSTPVRRSFYYQSYISVVYFLYGYILIAWLNVYFIFNMLFGDCNV
ncbi:G patch domain-containing protein TGH homolog [Cajanus cajan]|uniref:G patch domain-containing protein TGH homolog n=1 Tax=Cajanus cajan TaxID=3821 RepID=UPI0010FB2DD4|nr:G patch domain-containing protein TGH homolog [Cajanus cajan]